MVRLNEELPILSEEEMTRYHLTQESNLKIAELMANMGRLEQDNKYQVSKEMMQPPPKAIEYTNQTPVTSFTLGEREGIKKPEATVPKVPLKKEPPVSELVKRG